MLIELRQSTLSVTKKFFVHDLLLTLGGVAAAVLALACSLIVSGIVKNDLGAVQREGSTARVLAVLQAFDQELQHLTDYTTGYAMWDDSYAFVQKPSQDYIDTNYSPSVMFVSPARLVVVYDLERRILFSRALDESGKLFPVPAEVSAPDFTRKFSALKQNRDSFGTMAWLGGRGYLLTVCPITDSSGTAPIKGYLMFGSILDAKVLERIEALTTVRLESAERTTPFAGGIEMSTPTLGMANVDLEKPVDGYAQARAVFVNTDGIGNPVEFRMQVPSRLSGAAERISTMVRTLLFIVSGAFALFVLLVSIETARRRRELRARILESERLKQARDEADRLRVKAESADRAKSAFLAMMSHEIRTPLNAIIGYAELLRSVPLDREAQQGLQTIRESGGMLLRVLNDVLDFSRIEAGELAIAPEPVNIRALVAEVCALYGASADARSNRLSSDVDSNVPENLLIDGARVRQVLSNLLSNAVKFTQQGEICVAVNWERDRLTFQVEDEGIGVSADAEEGLFKPFIQAESTSSRRYDGSGLGLAICRRLCQLMDGDIAFRRGDRRGSIFSFHLPAPVAGAPLREIFQEAEMPLAGDLPSVLVVDDNLANARLMSSILKRFGITARIAVSGREAIQSYCEDTADIILMDIQMPDMDGLEATREIRRIEAEKKLSRSEIIAVTADILEHHRSDARAAGMDGYLSKPIKISEVQRVVTSHRKPGVIDQ
jgi:signal transduction histidine kinase/ActR/RegA family two-component response regulator